MIWVFLSQCISFDVEQLQAQLVQGEWYVKAASSSPQSYGTWIVNATTGSYEPWDGGAEDWKKYINSRCKDRISVAISTPAPTPVITASPEAVATLWSYLARCFSDLPVGDLEATLDPGKREWVVITVPGAETDYGVWRVHRNASIFPDNLEATGRDDEVKADCTRKVVTDEDAVDTMASYLAKCFIGLVSSDLVATPDDEESSTNLVDSRANFKTSGVQAGDSVRNASDSDAIWTVVSVNNDNDLTVELASSGQGDDHWAFGDSYFITDSGGKVLEQGFTDLVSTWTVITNEQAETNYGRWRVRQDAKLFPINSVARIRDEEVRSEQCTGGIFNPQDAVATLWTHLVQCSPTLLIEDLAATWDPSNGEWVVITVPPPKRVADQPAPTPQPDYGVWRVKRDATLSFVNQEAKTRDEKVKKGEC